MQTIYNYICRYTQSKPMRLSVDLGSFRYDVPNKWGNRKYDMAIYSSREDNDLKPFDIRIYPMHGQTHTCVYIYMHIWTFVFFLIRYKLQAKTLCGNDWVYLSCQSPSSVRSLGFEAGPVAWWGIVYHNIFCYTYMYNHIHIYNYASSSYVNSKHVSSITLQFQV